MVGFLKWAGGLVAAMVGLSLAGWVLVVSPWWLTVPLAGWFLWSVVGVEVLEKHRRRFPS